MIWMLACLDSPKELPRSRVDAPVSAQMVEYGSLKSFMITKGEPSSAIVFQTDTLDDASKNCALKQAPENTISLVISNPSDSNLAKQYLHRYKIVERKLFCSEL
ncbi:MAG: hypothetical protein VX278_00140 [Myxococcota bacterium]|nr:hypothetical protein [Myxococcota bacterium]